MITFQYLFRISTAATIFLACFFLVKNQEKNRNTVEGEDHALDAFEFWYNQRAYPYGIIPQDKFLRAVAYKQNEMANERHLGAKVAADTSKWVSIGPDNVGGRVLAIALRPNNSSIVWAGSASGGLWKSTTGGFGTDAWTYVNTGYPTMAVSAIAIDPLHPDTMYIGTGEVGAGYQYRQIGTPGARATYGMGILRSFDGGSSWTLSGLVWQFSQFVSIQKIVINPQNPNTVYAATTEGTYKSQDNGLTWSRVHDVLMAMDIVINPLDTAVLYAVYGQRNTSSNPGIYKTTNAGATWTKLGGGLPTAYFGRTALALSPSSPGIVYAGISDAYTSTMLGLYRTTDAGETWLLMSRTNYVGSQGWYDNTIAVSPVDPNVVYCAGLDVYKSVSGGSGLAQKSYWYAGSTGVVPNGGPEGTIVYSHADHHAIVIDPANPERIYFGNDGGVFFSGNGGGTFGGCNGGFVTTQFYNGFVNAVTDSLVALGGLQDNGTLKYEGGRSWNKVYGGDGGWCAIDPTNASILYEEYVYLAIAKSTNGGEGWFPSTYGLSTGANNANFIAPFVICPSDPNILYAGAKIVFTTYGGGDYWFPPSGTESFNGTSVSCIGVSYSSSDTLMAGTGGSAPSGTFPTFAIYASTTGGYVWDNVTGTLPARYPTDIAFDPTSSSTTYLTYSGYGTSHVFKTTNVGQSWTDISSNLPDIPVQAVAIDPSYPSNLYVGTDLGVFRTLDGGGSWHVYDLGMPPAMVLDIGISQLNRKLRASTFGNGVYERSLQRVPATISTQYRQYWNMLSVPLAVPDYHRSVLFPTSSAAYSFEGGYTHQDMLRSGAGYFLRLPSAQTVIFSGKPIYTDTIQVQKGWNLIGSISDTISTSSITSIPAGIADSLCYGFDGGYRLSSVLAPGKGYWMRAKQPGLLVLHSSGSSKQKRNFSRGTDPIAGLNTITVEDASGNHQTLYFGERDGLAYSLESFVMPPTPPAGVFDVRFTSQHVVELHDKNLEHSLDYPLTAQAAAYPLMISWKVADNGNVAYELSQASSVGQSLAVALRGEGHREVLHDEGSAFHLRVYAVTAEIPRELALEQNYPNPFNPTTRIQYQLPENTKVKIQVYDILGKHVRTLFDGLQNAGKWDIVWDGRDERGNDVSAGVYFCCLTSVSPQTGRELLYVRKMMLVR